MKHILPPNSQSLSPSRISEMNAPAFSTPFVGASKTPVYIGLRPSTCRLPTQVRAPCAARITPTAKIFDWKKRSDPNHGLIPEEDDGIYTLHNLKPAPGSRHRKKRKGRGDAAGQGSRSGFGMRGQKSRSGSPSRPGFEGGQTPLYRRIPKWVGRPTGPGHKKTEYALMKIDFLNGLEEGSVVTFEGLKEKGIMTKQKKKIYKVVGGTELTVKSLTVKAHAFTESAQQQIEGMGGTCVLVSPTTGKDIVFDVEESDE